MDKLPLAGLLSIPYLTGPRRSHWTKKKLFNNKKLLFHSCVNNGFFRTPVDWRRFQNL